MEPYVIGLDLGTGSGKALAITQGGKVIDTAQVSYPTRQPEPGFQEQDPEEVWQAFVRCLSTITRSQGHPPAGIALSSAMHSIMALGPHNTLLTHAITWADNRSAPLARALHQSAAAQSLYETTGTPIHPMSPLCKLQWLRAEAPDVFRRAEKFISLKEYIWHRLFHEFEVDYSIASASGLMDINKKQWHDEALAVAGITSEKLSTLTGPFHRRTCQDHSLRQTMGIDEATPFFVGASDGCLASLGSFATEPGTVGLTIGTSGAVRVMRDKPVLNFGAMIFNYLLDENTFICGGPTNNGGIALRWYAENIRGVQLRTLDDYQHFLREIDESVPGARGLTFLPFVLGERAPVWNSEACGVFFGMRSHHKPGDFTRAVIEGISTALYDIAEHMIEAGLDIQHLHVSGGFVHSPAWLQLLADLFGKRISLVNTADASAYGAAMVALKALGIITRYDALRPEELQSYAPEATAMTAYRELFLRYRKIYDATQHLMV